MVRSRSPAPLALLLLVGCASSSKYESHTEAPADAAEAAPSEESDSAAESVDAPIFRDTPYDPARFGERATAPTVDRAAQDTVTLPWDGDTAGFDFLEAALAEGNLPPAGALRAAELVNALARTAAPCAQVACLHTAAVPSPRRADRVVLVAQLVAGDAGVNAPVTLFLDDEDPAAARVQTRRAVVVRRSERDLAAFLEETAGPVVLALSAGLTPLPAAWQHALARRRAPLFILGFGEHQDRALDHMSSLAGGRYAFGVHPPHEAKLALTDVNLDVQLTTATRRWSTSSAHAVRGAFLLGAEAATWTLEVEPDGDGPLARVTARFLVDGAPSALSGEVRTLSADWAQRAAHAAVLADAIARRDRALLRALTEGPLAAYATRALAILEEAAR